MQFECKQIECKLVPSLIKPNAIKQQSNELGKRSGTKELVALLIISAMQDQSSQQMPKLGVEQVKNVNREKSLEQEVAVESWCNAIRMQTNQMQARVISHQA
jgi:hypothetical protein